MQIVEIIFPSRTFLPDGYDFYSGKNSMGIASRLIIIIIIIIIVCWCF